MSKEGCGCFSAFIILVIALVFLDVPIVWIAVGTVVVIILFNLLFSTPTARPKLFFNKDCRMDESYFQQISKAVDDLLAEYENACSSPEFVKQIEESGLSQYIDGQPLGTAAEKVRLLFWQDAVRCYKGLGLQCEKVNKESYGLYYFIERTLEFEKLSYKNYPKLYRAKNHVLSEAFIKDVEKALRTMPAAQEDFAVASLYGNIDGNLRQRYMVRLYRFASIVAKADNTVTEQEAAWLRTLMQNGGIPENESGEKRDSHTHVYADYEEGKGESASPSRPRSAAYQELQNLIGLESVKKEVETLSDFIHIQNTRQQKGMKTSPISYHCVFTGNPGTGKTTVARILAKIYKSLGVVSKGHLVETDRSGLIAEYVGQTAIKTNLVIDRAIGGVLFIDEAYSLLGRSGEDYGKEAVATLLKRMEDERGKFVVILAGYTKEMKEFIDSNPGLQSRFSRYIEFPDYNADELYQIFCKQLKQFDYTITPDAAEALQQFFAYQVAHKDANFGNARFVRNIFEHTLQRQAARLSKEVNLTTEKLAEVTKEDLPWDLD